MPILRFGPNNQITGLKEALVIGKLLGRTTILPDIREHHKAIGNETDDHAAVLHKVFPFEQLFDVQRMQEFGKVIEQSKLLGSGWSGRIDAVLYWSDRDLAALRRFEHAGFHVGDTAVMVRTAGNTICSPPQAAHFRSKFFRQKVVAVPVYEKVVADAHRHLLDNATIDAPDFVQRCYSLYHKATRKLQKAPHIRAMAEEFIEQYMGSFTFGAVHIRPYPNECLERWRDGDLNSSVFSQQCRSPSFHLQVGVQTREALQRAGVVNPKVFVSAHPYAHALINRTFQEQGLEAVYLPAEFALRRGLGNPGGDEAGEDTTPSSGPGPTPGLMFVEQEIAVRSSVFVGTFESSFTATIRQERGARGVAPGVNAVFHAA